MGKENARARARAGSPRRRLRTAKCIHLESSKVPPMLLSALAQHLIRRKAQKGLLTVTVPARLRRRRKRRTKGNLIHIILDVPGRIQQHRRSAEADAHHLGVKLITIRGIHRAQIDHHDQNGIPGFVAETGRCAARRLRTVGMMVVANELIYLRQYPWRDSQAGSTARTMAIMRSSGQRLDRRCTNRIEALQRASTRHLRKR